VTYSIVCLRYKSLVVDRTVVKFRMNNDDTGRSGITEEFDTRSSQI